MVQVVDTKTNEVQDLPAQDAQKAIMDGTHALQQTSSGTIQLTNPQGQVFTGPTANAYGLLAKGWHLETQTERAKVDVAKEAAEAPTQSAIEQGGESFFNQLAAGIPGIVNEHSETEYGKAHREAEEETHGTARAIGGIAGFAGSALAGGPAFKGATLAGRAVEGAVAGEGASLGSRLLGKALGGAVEGGLVSTPQTITEAAVGDPQKAAESLALGAGIGSILGFGGGALDELKGALRQTGEPAEKAGLLDALQSKADKSANQDALRLAGMQKSQLKKIPDADRQALGDVLFQKGLIKPGMSKEDIATAIKDFHETSGEAVRSHLGKLDEVLDAQPELKALAFNPRKAANRIRAELGEGLDNPLYQAENKHVQDIADSVEQLGPTKSSAAEDATDVDINNATTNFRTAQDAKNLFSKFKWNKINPTEKEQLQQRAYGIVKEEMDKAAEGVASASGDDALFNSYMGAKKDFQNASTLLPGADNLMAGQGGNRKVGLSDFIVGAGAGGLAGAAHAVLGPLGAPAAFLGSIFLKHLAENQGNILSATALKRFGNADLSKLGVLSAIEGSSSIDSLINSGLTDALKGKAVSGIQRLDPLSALLGPHANGLSKAQQFDKVSQAIQATQANPETMAENINSITAAMKHTGAPETANALGAQYSKTAQYLQQALPKAPVANPFIKTAPWKPTAEQMTAFQQKAQVVANPFSVLDELGKGTLSANHLEALQQVYPAIYEQIKDAAVHAAASKDTSTPYAVRLKMSLLFGKAVDPSLANIASLQANYAPPIKPSSGQGHKITAPNLSTDTQRISA